MGQFFLKYFTVKTDRTGIQLFRYFFSGGSAFVIYLGFLVVLTDIFQMFHLVSLVIAYGLSIFWNFFISKYFVFSNTKQPSFLQLGKFFGVAMIGLVCQFLIVSSLTTYVSMQYLAANSIASALVFILSFTLNKLITFRFHVQK